VVVGGLVVVVVVIEVLLVEATAVDLAEVPPPGDQRLCFVR